MARNLQYQLAKAREGNSMEEGRMATKKSKPAIKGSKKAKKLSGKKELSKAKTLSVIKALRGGPFNA